MTVPETVPAEGGDKIGKLRSAKSKTEPSESTVLLFLEACMIGCKQVKQRIEPGSGMAKDL